jgi:hypothetical protein
MEHLFSPCTRVHDQLGRLEECRVRHPAPYRELNLDISTKEFLSAERALTYKDLDAMLGNEETIAWLTPHAFVIRSGGTVMDYWCHLSNAEGYELSHFTVSADGRYVVALARSPEHFLEIFDVVLRLLAASVVHSVTIHNWTSRAVSISATSLAYLMEHCHSSLKALTLIDLEMDDSHCRVLGGYSRPDLDIVLFLCKLTSVKASVLAAILGRNQGPTELSLCEIDYSVLANGLRGNSRLQSFRTSNYSSPADSGREALLIAGALRENKGLVSLRLHYGSDVNDETWVAVCDSLKAHPTLEVFDFRAAKKFENTFELAEPSVFPAVIKSRVQVLLDMLKVNTSIHTLRLDSCYKVNEIFLESVIPYLETNRFRLRIRAIQKTHPTSYRAKVLGRALLAVRTDPNRFWMLLSGNAEVSLPSTTANLPTPA